MTTTDIANDFINMCRQGQFQEAQDKYFTNETRSIEAMGDPKEVQGLEAIGAKGEQFFKTFEVHGMEVSAPIVSTDHFACIMSIDSTHRESNQRSSSSEVCVFEVKDGKIVLEQFFYNM